MSFNSINRATILGRLGRDPEIRTMLDGKKVATFSMATSTSWTDKSGDKKETTDWHNIVVFNEANVKFIEQYVKKGSRLYIEGKIKTRKWTDKKGNEKYTTEIIVSGFDSRVIALDNAPTKPAHEIDDYNQFFSQKTEAPYASNHSNTYEIDDIIPF